MATDRAASRVSGILVLDQLRLAEEMLGKEAIAEAIARMPAKDREELLALLPVSWCTLEAATSFHVAVAAVVGEDVRTWHRRIVRGGLERTFTTIWRFLVRFTTLEALVKRAASIYTRSYDQGAMTARLAAPGHAELTVTGWPNIPELECDALACGIETVLHISGRAQAKVTWRRTPAGVDFTVKATP